MRILHVNKFLYRRGGAEGYMLDVVGLQRERGHTVEVFGMQHPDNDAPLPLQDTFPPYVELEPAPGGLAGVAASARMLWSPSSGRGMAQAIRRFRPDVLHLHNIYHQLSPSVLAAARRAGVPVVMTLHDYKLACPSYQMLDHGRLCDACVTGGTMQAARRRCKGGSLGASTVLSVESTLHRYTHAYSPVGIFVSPSRFLAEVMGRAGVYPERMRVINHFADVSGTPVATRPGTGFTFAGRLSHEKGVDTLIRAVAQLPDASLQVAGDGPERAALERLATEVAPGRVHFHGRLAKPELGELVRASLATVVPSRWNENQPMTILESFGAGVPVVVTRLGGMPELVTDGRDGLVVPHEDPAALADALSRLQADPAAAHRMGLAGRDRVQQDFGVEQHLDRLEGVYAEAGASLDPAAVPTPGASAR